MQTIKNQTLQLKKQSAPSNPRPNQNIPLTSVNFTSAGLGAALALLLVGAIFIAIEATQSSEESNTSSIKSDITEEDVARAHKILALAEIQAAEATHDSIVRKISQRNVKSWPLRPSTESSTPAD